MKPQTLNVRLQSNVVDAQCDCMCLLCVCTLTVAVCRRCCRCSVVKSHDKWQKRRLDSTHARAWLRFNIYRYIKIYIYIYIPNHKSLPASIRVQWFADEIFSMHLIFTNKIATDPMLSFDWCGCGISYTVKVCKWIPLSIIIFGRIGTHKSMS